jgi:broad specificity phosphatase PhoE
MELLLIRHGEAEPVTDGAGSALTPLTEAGRAQAGRLANDLAAGLFGEIRAVVCSTMNRARQTAMPIADAVGLEIRSDPRLAELDVEWSSYGTGVEDTRTRQAGYDELNAGRWGRHRYDPAAFTARVHDGIDDVVTQVPDGAAAVICHGGVISAYLAHLLGLDRVMFLTPDHCSITRVLAEPGGYREILSVNERSFLRP